MPIKSVKCLNKFNERLIEYKNSDKFISLFFKRSINILDIVDKLRELYSIVDKHFPMTKKYLEHRVDREYDRIIQLVMYEDLIVIELTF